MHSAHLRGCLRARAHICVCVGVMGLTVRVGWNDSVTRLSGGQCCADRDLAERSARWLLLRTLTGTVNTHIINKHSTKVAESVEVSHGNLGTSEIMNLPFSLHPVSVLF